MINNFERLNKHIKMRKLSHESHQTSNRTVLIEKTIHCNISISRKIQIEKKADTLAKILCKTLFRIKFLKFQKNVIDKQPHKFIMPSFLKLKLTSFGKLLRLARILQVEIYYETYCQPQMLVVVGNC